MRLSEIHPTLFSNRLRALLALALIWMLAACNASAQTSDNVTYVIITGQPPDALATQAPSVEPTIPPTPTPDIPPDVALRIADRYLLDGYYENAVFTFQNVLVRTDASPEIRASAAFGMGQAALREGLFADSVSALTTLITNFPDDFRAALAYFLRGDAYLGLSQWQAAIDDFQRYLLLRPGLIDSYAHERIGDAQLALGQFGDALASYTQATQASRSLVPQLALRERVAQVHISAGQVAQAVAQYDSILEVARNAPYRATIDYRAAQALLNAGDTDGALVRMARIFNEYPSQPEAYQAMGILQQSGLTLDNYLRGRVAFSYGDYETAIEAFNAHTTETLLNDIPAQLYMLLGQAYRALGNSDAAQVAFQTVIDQYPNDTLFGDALLEQGRTLFLAGNIDAAIDRYLAIASTYGYLTATAAQAMWRAGYLHSTNGRPNEARPIFERLAELYPGTDEARSGLFIAASAAVNAGDTVGAEALFGRLAATTTGTDQANAFLWVGRLARQRGEDRLAQDALNQAVAAAPDSYYGARAQDILVDRAPFTPPLQYRFEFDDLADVTAAEEWLRQRFGAPAESPLWPLSPELEADPRIVRGRELWTVGAFAAAETEFLDILEAYRQDGLASYRLAIFMRSIGSYYPSLVGAANVITAAGVSTMEAPAYIARMRYPSYYRDVVLQITTRYNIDPLLMLSLIRHESLFNTNATAAAGEKGLTQVIPSTGEYIAGALNWQNYQHSDLFRPYAGIEFGAFYLAEQLNRFNRNTYAALAGYNAGPGRALSWLELSGGDPDLFMATITIDSVQLYIQRIYSHYSIYRQLYGVS